MAFSIIQADSSHMEILVPLFDGYRQFYGQPSDLVRVREFLAARLTSGDSIILLAMDDTNGVGFTQLYPSFSSVAMQRIWILNDLFVRPTARRTGVGRHLLESAANFARSTSATRLVLATANDNHQAKALYEKLGWQLDQDFDHYALTLGDT
jgi:GNAT superfamily N-acetyltransferase